MLAPVSQCVTASQLAALILYSYFYAQRQLLLMWAPVSQRLCALLVELFEVNDDLSVESSVGLYFGKIRALIMVYGG